MEKIEVSVGPEEMYIDDYEIGDYVWIVYWYESGDYCGSGEAIWLSNDGKYYWKSLSHCSCYGPCYGGGEVIDINALLGSKDDIHAFDCCEAIKDEIAKLVA